MWLFTGHGFAPNTVSGWEMLEQLQGTNWNGAHYIKVLTSADITAGSVTITYSGSFNGVRAGIVFQGTQRIQIRAFECSRNSSGSSSRTLSTDATPRAGDYVVAFGSARVASAVTCNVGAQLRQVNATSASGVLNGGVLGSDGVVSATFSYGGAPSGDFQAVAVLGV
jgi:hypothetical protein